MNRDQQRRIDKIVKGDDTENVTVRYSTHSSYVFEFAVGEFGPELQVHSLIGEATHPLTGRRMRLMAIDRYPLQDPANFRLMLASVLDSPIDAPAGDIENDGDQ